MMEFIKILAIDIYAISTEGEISYLYQYAFSPLVSERW
jgi:hypothetical protein